MTQSGIWIAILTGAAVSFLVRALPMTLIRKKITNRFFRSFLYYVPYATLAVMTFPAMIDAAGNPAAGIAVSGGAGQLCNGVSDRPAALNLTVNQDELFQMSNRTGMRMVY